MEVHHHPHVEEKNFKEYFLEFLMIFLAVTLGFFAENIREHFVDKEIEKQSIQSIANSLASDTLQLEVVINRNVNVIEQLDSLMQIRNSNLNIEANKKVFLRHSILGFSQDWYFNTNDAALQQLKSSGTLRLIQKQNIVDSIFKYELKNKALVSQQQDCYWTFQDGFNDYKKAINVFFLRDTTVAKFSMQFDRNDIEFKNTNEVFITTDKEKINNLFGNAATLATVNEFYVHLMQDQLGYGKSLIAFLKKEYNLKDE